MALSGVRIIARSLGNGPTLSDSVAATSILNVSEKKLLPANFFYVGKMLRITGCGQLSNVVTTPGTLTLDVRLNSTPIIVANGGAMVLSTTAHTTVPFWFEFLLTCQVVGSGTTAKLMGAGWALSKALCSTSGADSAVTHGGITQPVGTPAQGTGFNSTVNNLLDIFATFSVATDPTNLTLNQYLVEELN